MGDMKRWRKWLKRAGLGLLAMVLAAAGWWVYDRRTPVAPTEIFKGVTYSCEQLPATPESGGLMHLVKIDLKTPGLELYVTPLDPPAVEQGGETFLRWLPFAAKDAKLSVATNACMFMSGGWPPRKPGDLAKSAETIVIDGKIVHEDPHSFILWFDDELTPHMERRKPAPRDVVKRAKLAVGGRQAYIYDGVPSRFLMNKPDRQMLIGFDDQKNLYLAGFDHASQAFVMKTMIDRGVKFATLFDSGSCTGMYLGGEAKNIRPGTVMYPQCGVATIFGVRAPLLDAK